MQFSQKIRTSLVYGFFCRFYSDLFIKSFQSSIPKDRGTNSMILAPELLSVIFVDMMGYRNFQAQKLVLWFLQNNQDTFVSLFL